jgi:HD-GYP domain-containing protein (c-di-GMP phosphodiesterase class II)
MRIHPDKTEPFARGGRRAYGSSCLRKTAGPPKDVTSGVPAVLRFKATKGVIMKDTSQSITELAVEIARRMSLSEEEIRYMRRGALLHDIGQIGVPYAVLHKPGKLTEEEWAQIRKHPQIAYELISSIEHLRPAADVPYCHHEKWDGSGYPRGLKGKQIPLTARIFALVDVWDAIPSERPYRPPWPDEKALDYIEREAGKHFDPRVVEVFLEILRGKKKGDSETTEGQAEFHQSQGSQ